MVSHFEWQIRAIRDDGLTIKKITFAMEHVTATLPLGKNYEARRRTVYGWHMERLWD